MTHILMQSMTHSVVQYLLENIINVIPTIFQAILWICLVIEIEIEIEIENVKQH